jgi:hypothetical protein
MKEIQIIDMSGMGTYFNPTTFIIVVCVSIAFAIALYVLRSIGLYVMAKKQELKHKTLAFVPILWVYVMAKLIGKVFILGKERKGFAITITVIFTIFELLSLTSSFLAYFPLVGYYLSGGEIVINLAEEGAIFGRLVEYPLIGGIYVQPLGTGVGLEMPYANVLAVSRVIYIFDIIAELLSIAYLFASIFIYINLFRKYWPRHFILALVLSILIDPAFAILVFCLRKREPMSYEEYLRSIGVRIYNPYVDGQNVNGNPPRENSNANNPFEDFPEEKTTHEEPFSEFNKKD